MPRIDANDDNDQYRHRYLTSSYISDVGSDAIIRIFRRALAQNVNFYESFFRIEDCRRKKEEAERQKRLSKIYSLHKQEISNISDQKLDEAIEEEQKRIEAESNAKILYDELSRQKIENYRLANQVEIMRTAASRCADMEKALSARLSIDQYPNSTDEIISYFSCLFGDTIAFSDDAKKSLKYCSIPNSYLWRTLFCLATVMHELFAQNNPDPYREFKNRTGIDCARGEGTMTRKDKKLMEQFSTEFDGRIIDIEPHITFPRERQSIHFGYDDINQKVIIGHCGKHLEIYSTLKSRK